MSEASRHPFASKASSGSKVATERCFGSPACLWHKKGGREGTENYVVGTVHEGTCNALFLLKKLRFLSARCCKSVSEASRHPFASKASSGSKVATERCFGSTFQKAGAGALGQLLEQLLAPKCRSESPAENSLLNDEERNQELEQTEQPKLRRAKPLYGFGFVLKETPR